MIIGVAGEKKHGKDTVANYLKTKYGYEQMAFADMLKNICSKAFNVSISDMYNEELKEALFDQPIQLHYMSQMSVVYNLLGNISVSSRQMDAAEIKFIEKKEFTSIRDMLQFMGTNILRDIFDPDFHYNSVAKHFKANEVKAGVVSDVRFANERLLLKQDFDAKLILVVRPSMVRNETSSHASETSLGDPSEYDYVVINDGTIEDLYTKIDVIMTANK
jgi:hypothetical protein